jgi:hypothetical protein
LIPINNAKAEHKIESIMPFRYSKLPITKPIRPVVKSRMAVSSTLTNVRMNAEANRTDNPSEILNIAAIASGSVLKGLMTNPTVGKNIGAA